MIMDNVWEFITEQTLQFVGIVAIILILAAAAVFREWFLMSKLRDLWLRLRGQHPPMCAADVEMDRSIHELLVELRAVTDADRARVFQFHNGQVFTSNNPLWKASCTHESCRQGISHEIAKSQAIIASAIWELLEPLFNASKLMTGIARVDDRNPNTPELFWVNVRAMPEGYCKSLLISQGVRFCALSPIYDGRNIYGFISASYCGEAEAGASIEAVRKCASNVGFILKRGNRIA